MHRQRALVEAGHQLARGALFLLFLTFICAALQMLLVFVDIKRRHLMCEG